MKENVNKLTYPAPPLLDNAAHIEWQAEGMHEIHKKV